ncbi:haloacid dehalogenase type II [Saccharothrix stipae]
MLCVLDVNETLLDLASLDDFFADLTGDAGARREWFDLLIHNALTTTALGGYKPLGEIAGACLGSVAAAHGGTVTGEHEKELAGLLRELPAHPEVADAIARLREAGFGVVTLTNSVAAVVEDQMVNSGLRPLIDAIYAADQVQRLKPAPEPYRLVLREQGVAASDAVLVAAHDWDVAGAAAAGLNSAFVAREGRKPLPAADAPTIVGDDLDDVATRLIAKYGS